MLFCCCSWYQPGSQCPDLHEGGDFSPAQHRIHEGERGELHLHMEIALTEILLLDLAGAVHAAVGMQAWALAV